MPLFLTHLARRCAVILLILTGIFSSVLPLRAETPLAKGGTVTGKVSWTARAIPRIPVEKYAGSISGQIVAAPIPLAGVWIEGPGLSAPTSPPRINFSQKGYQFAQSLLVVSRGTTVVFPNEDTEYHNVFSLSKTARFDLGRYKKEAAPAPEVTFSKTGLVRLQCEIHEHMRAQVLVVESPHFTTTSADGSFKLSGLPPGQWTLRVQLDEKTQWHAPIVTKAGQSIVAQLVPGPPAVAPVP